MSWMLLVIFQVSSPYISILQICDFVFQKIEIVKIYFFVSQRMPFVIW